MLGDTSFYAPDDPTARALREGRHSIEHETLCTNCRRWVRVIWWRVGQTQLCRDCAPPDRHAVAVASQEYLQ